MRQAQQIFDYASNQYATQPEYLWEKYPEYAILRHGNAKGKWYALIGKISKTKLGLKEEGETDFINHMNKTHWLTIVLDHGVETKEIFKLLDWSYDLTK